MLQPIRRVPLRSCSLSRKPFFAPKTQYRTIKHDSSNENAEGNETYESVKERFKRMKLYYKSLSKSEPTPDISEAREKDQQVTNSYHYTLAADQLAQLSKEMKDFRGLTTDQASKLPKKLEKVEKELTNTKTAVLELATNQLAQLSKEIEGFRGVTTDQAFKLSEKLEEVENELTSTKTAVLELYAKLTSDSTSLHRQILALQVTAKETKTSTNVLQWQLGIFVTVFTGFCGFSAYAINKAIDFDRSGQETE